MSHRTRGESPEDHLISHTGLLPSMAGLSRTVLLSDDFITSGYCGSSNKTLPHNPTGATTAVLHTDGLGYSPFARRY